MSEDELLRLQRRIHDLERGRRYAASQDYDQMSTTPPPHPDPSGLRGNHANDANAMMGLMEEENQSHLNHVGDSSATSFMNQIKKVINQQGSPPASRQQSQSVRGQAPLTVQPSHSKQQRQILDYVLPSRQKADHLLEIYWRLVDTLYPFLDKDEVVSTYRSLWTGNALDDEGPIFLCLLNVIFSLACILDPSVRPEERVSSANVFYQRSRELLDFELVQHQSILTVQYFLLLGQYLQSTKDPQQCWTFVGLAIRIAQSLGLDLPSKSAQAQSAQRRDVLRKVWHGCVLMDRTLSMTFGRPAMITSQAAAAVPRPMTHQECICSTETCILDHNSDQSCFFIESLRLYELMSETLLTLYNPASREEPNDNPYAVYFGSPAAGNVFEMDSRFLLWSRDLPVHLRYELNATKSGIHLRQTNVLWLRYRHIRILLFRPILSRFCCRYDNSERSLEEAMPWKIALQCSIICVKIAMETIEFFDSRMKATPQENLDDLLPAWWYSIFYVYTAATVLVAGRLHPSITAEVTEQAITSAWHAVMRVLGRFQSFSKHAKRCAAALSVLFDQVPQQHQHQQQRLQQRRNRKSQQQQQLRRHQEAGDTGHQGMADPMHPTNIGPSAASFPEHPIVDRNIGLSGAGAVQWAVNQPYPIMPDSGSLVTDDSPPVGTFDTSDVQLDLGDMSWLSSIPFQLDMD